MLGIAIALGAESLVKHHRIGEAVDYSRSDFVDELTANRAEVAADLQRSRPLDRQMAALIAEGGAFVAGRRAIADQHRFSRSFPQLRSAAWAGALSTQVMGHFPHAEGRAVARAYSEQAALEAVEERARDRWFDLARFSFAEAPTRAQVAILL